MASEALLFGLNSPDPPRTLFKVQVQSSTLYALPFRDSKNVDTE